MKVRNYEEKSKERGTFMISSVTDTQASITQIRMTSGARQEVDFDKVLNEAVSVKEGEEENTEVSGGKKTLEQIFIEASEKYNVPLNLLKAVAKQESDFNQNSLSHSGAQGIMQLMPATARFLGVKDAFDPQENIMGGAKYLSQKLKMYNGDITLALAAYNAGSGNVSKYGGVPPFAETQNYVKKVRTYMQQDIKIPDITVNVSGKSASDTVSAKRQAAASSLELKASEAPIAQSPSGQLLSVSENSMEKTMQEKLALYYQEQEKASVSSVMEKLLLQDADMSLL